MSPRHSPIATSAIAILMAEHRIIEQVLDCTDVLGRMAVADQAIPTAYAVQAVELLACLADANHHDKEERILFPVIERLSPGDDLSAVMRHDHERGRKRIQALRDAIATGDATWFGAAVRGYTGTLREHIQIEDGHLYPRIQALLDPESDARLVERFRIGEHDGIGFDRRQELLVLAGLLADHCQVPRAHDDPRIAHTLTAWCGSETP
jgi:hemerythrin-like domain-containing protein